MDDDILTVDTNLQLPWRDMMQSHSMNYHYLFHLQSKLAINAFGKGYWAIRLPAGAIGLGAIAAMWWLAHSTQRASLIKLPILG